MHQIWNFIPELSFTIVSTDLLADFLFLFFNKFLNADYSLFTYQN